MTEYSRMAKGSFTNTAVSSVAPTSAFVILPFQPDYVELWNYTNIKTAGTHSITRAWWDASLIDTATNTNPTMVELYSSSQTSVVFDQISTNGISTFSGGLDFQFGAVVQHGGSPVSDFAINKAAAAQITTVGNHGLSSGNVVIFSNLAQTSTTGMQQIAGIPFVITVTGATTFTIPWNTSQSNYTAFNTATSTNNVGSYKQVFFPALYNPGQTYISAISTGATTVVSLTMPGNFVVGQEVALRIPAVWGTTQLNSLPNLIIPGSPIYGFVTAVSASLTTPTITLSINSTGYTAFNSNQPFASAGRSAPQVVPVGDINSGSNQSNFLSPQVWNGTSNALTTSINGPAIAGAFCNNTNQGFVIGAGVAVADTTATFLSGTTTNVVYWHAYKHDFASP